MEQLEQLKTMRDQAAERLEAARAAIEKSPDAKLFNSLGPLISDLEESFGLASADSDDVVAEAVEGAPVEPIVEDEPTAKEEEASEEVAEKASDLKKEMSLEESLEAELLGEDPA